jgi:phosphopantetheinyl transferase
MPLALHLNTLEGSSLGLWRMEETVEELKGFQIEQKVQQDIHLSQHPLRLQQQLCTKILLDTLLSAGPIQMAKDEAGRPWPANVPGFLSISHNPKYVALLYNPERPCGIDIEQPSDRILRIASRFVHPEENEQIRKEHRIEDTTLIWCVKECVFKQIGRQGVIFKDQLRVKLPKDRLDECTGGQAFDLHQEPPTMYRYQWHRLDNLLLVHTIA